MKLTDLVLADRRRLIHDTKNIDLIYDLLEKHFPNLTRSQIQSRYKLQGDFIKNRLFIISDDTSAIVDMFNMTSRLGVKYESVGNFKLRADLYLFIDKVI